MTIFSFIKLCQTYLCKVSDLAHKTSITEKFLATHGDIPSLSLDTFKNVCTKMLKVVK